jgi:hypothetical protein
MLNHAVGFGSKAPLKKLRNLCLTLGRGPWQLTEELGFTEAGITVFEGIDSSEQRKLQDACLL